MWAFCIDHLIEITSSVEIKQAKYEIIIIIRIMAFVWLLCILLAVLSLEVITLFCLSRSLAHV